MEQKNALGYGEQVSMTLASLYDSFGYRKFKMSKFEEYDLYLENKSFLLSESVIAFNDPSGKLMALKPDVTLSIAKNTDAKETGTRKLFYSENVYRVSGSMHEFREIPQIGLELIGEVDRYSLTEVLLLAKRSLATINESYVLDISHMGLVIGLLEAAELKETVKEEISELIGTKNTPEIRKICCREGVKGELCDKLCALASLYGSVEAVLPKARELVVNETTAAAVNELSALCEALSESGEADNINIDFSVVSDITYYNGITFRGFIENVPGCILSGGRYDNLLIKMGKAKQAVGFAVYLDLLGFLYKNTGDFDVDVLLTYTENTPVAEIIKAAKEIVSKGETVRVAPSDDGSVKYRRKEAMAFVKGSDGK